MPKAVAGAGPNVSLRTVVLLAQAKERLIALSRRRKRVRYANYDHDGAAPLEWDELHAVLPRRLREQHSPSTLRTWFEQSSKDGGHTASVNDLLL